MARSVWTRSFTNIVSPNKLWQSVIITEDLTFEHLMPKLWQCQLVVVVGCIWTRSPTVGTKISGKNHYLTTSTLPYLLPHFTHSQDSNFYLCINRLHLTTHHEWTIKWGYVLSTTLNFHATCLHQRLKQRKRRTATKEFERTRIRFFIYVFTGVTVVLSQGLYGCLSKAETTSQRKRNLSLLTSPQNFVYAFSLSWNYTKKKRFLCCRFDLNKA